MRSPSPQWWDLSRALPGRFGRCGCDADRGWKHGEHEHQQAARYTTKSRTITNSTVYLSMLATCVFDASTLTAS